MSNCKKFMLYIEGYEYEKLVTLGRTKKLFKAKQVIATRDFEIYDVSKNYLKSLADSICANRKQVGKFIVQSSLVGCFVKGPTGKPSPTYWSDDGNISDEFIG